MLGGFGERGEEGVLKSTEKTHQSKVVDVVSAPAYKWKIKIMKKKKW